MWGFACQIPIQAVSCLFSSAMHYGDLIKPAIHRQPVYEPGRPIELVAAEFGLAEASIAKLASNENPLGPSPKAVQAMQQAASQTHLYPENSAFFLRQALAPRLGVEASQITVGAGSNELFYLLGDLFLAPGVEAVMGQHAFIAYKIVTLLHGATPVEVPLVDYRHDLEAMLAAITEKTRLVFLPAINNPTGPGNTPAEIEAFAARLPAHVLLCLDEAYAEYAKASANMRPLIEEGRKILVTRTFSKIYGLGGIRLGYGWGDPELIALLNRVRPPFNVSSLALAAGLAALDDEVFVERSRAVNAAGLKQLQRGLDQLNLSWVPSEGNFLMVRFAQADTINQALLRRGLIVRPLAGYALPDFLRVTVGTEEQNDRLLRSLESLLDPVASASA